MSKLHMNFPVWTWLYDYGPLTNPESWGDGIGLNLQPDVYPQAHTYCFLSEEDAMKYAKDHWPTSHGYILCKTYLQTDMDYPAMSGKAVV